MPLRLLVILLSYFTRYYLCDGEPTQVQSSLAIVTHLHYSERSGVLVAYKLPETPGTDYSPTGNLVDRCVIYFATGDTRGQAKNARDEHTLAKNMTWSTAGRYYYYEDDDTNIYAGTFTSKTYELLNSTGSVIFIDCLTAVLSVPLLSCNAEKDDTDVSNTCSEYFTILGVFADSGQTTVDQCTVISRSEHNPLILPSVTTTTITATVTVTKPPDKLPHSTTQKEDMSTETSTKGTSSLKTSTVTKPFEELPTSNTQKEGVSTITSTERTSSLKTSTDTIAPSGVQWTIIIAAVLPTLILSVTMAVIIVKLRRMLIVRSPSNITIDSSSTDDPYYTDLKSESSFSTYDTPASLHSYLSVDQRSEQAAAVINHGYDDQGEIGKEEGMYGGNVYSVHLSEMGQYAGMYGGNVYSVNASETSAN